jgi:hypothetical protein
MRVIVVAFGDRRSSRRHRLSRRLRFHHSLQRNPASRCCWDNLGSSPDSLLEREGFELAVPQQGDHTNATIADSPVWLSTKVEPILWPLTASLTHHDEWK